ncbi:MAG TPA: hypothetical protein VFJ94_10075 [Intrasporangium sp.]|uniref:allene oxide cyclase barrel-like domain-containing protein n=1 Tax=Intrasporangium sp. TaxID=1925024 RepID=UPI002D79CC61|nr:hypothetical protein [Intrasporangium sp.]HET7398855.1 hypothetical protein [Intrasporangium sp.]
MIKRFGMSKRFGITAAAAGLVGLAMGPASPAAGSDGDNGGEHRTITVTEVVLEQSFVDVGAKGPSLGDQFVFSGKLMMGGKQVGHDGGACTFTSMKLHEAICSAALSLAGGQVAVQGLVVDGQKDFTVPVTGGSGAFKEASGELRVHQLTQTTSTLTLRLRG